MESTQENDLEVAALTCKGFRSPLSLRPISSGGETESITYRYNAACDDCVCSSTTASGLRLGIGLAAVAAPRSETYFLGLQLPA